MRSCSSPIINPPILLHFWPDEGHKNMKVKNKPSQHHLFHFLLDHTFTFSSLPRRPTKKTPTQMLLGVRAHHRSDENKLEKDGGLFGRPMLKDNYYYPT